MHAPRLTRPALRTGAEKELDETHDLTPAECRTAHHAALNREPQRV